MQEKIKSGYIAYPPQEENFHSYYSTQQIVLSFPQTWIVLAGYNYGVKVFNKQVAPYIRYDVDVVTIKIPNNIKIINSSFLHGFLMPACEVLGSLNAVKEKIQIASVSKKIVQKYLTLNFD